MQDLSPTEREALYQKVLELSKKGTSSRQISKQLNISRKTTTNWVSGRTKPDRPIDVKPLSMTAYEIGFIVGLIEGEGNIGTSRYKRASRRSMTSIYKYIIISNTSIPLLEEAQKIIGGQIRPHHSPNSSPISWKNCYVLKITNMPQILSILKTISPKLIGKRKVALLMMKLIESRLAKYHTTPYNEDEKRLIAELHEANLRGVRNSGSVNHIMSP